MAKDNSRLFAPGVRVTEHWSINEYYGSAEALSSAGLVLSTQFPGQPGMAKCCVTFYGEERLGRGKQCSRDEKYLRIQTAGKKFRVAQGVSEEIQDERRSVEEAQWEAAQEVERLAAAAQAEAREASARNKRHAEITLEMLPTSQNDYRQKLIKDFDFQAGIARARMLPKKGNGLDIFSLGVNGFSLDEADINEFDDLVNEIKGLLLNAGVRFNAQRQKEIISNCKGAVARGDAKFQRVLAACTE